MILTVIVIVVRLIRDADLRTTRELASYCKKKTRVCNKAPESKRHLFQIDPFTCDRRESPQNFADSCFSVETTKTESLQHITESYFNIEIRVRDNFANKGVHGPPNEMQTPGRF